MTPTIFGLPARTQSFITTQGVKDRHELHDLQSDPQQKKNLLGRYRNGMNVGRMEPFIADPGKRQLYAELDARLDGAVKALGATRQASRDAV